jgi:hypothetical protein
MDCEGKISAKKIFDCHKLLNIILINKLPQKGKGKELKAKL